MYKKRRIALLLAVCMLTCLPPLAENVFATSAEDKKNEAENNLGNVTSEIEDIKDSQQQVEDKLTKIRIELADLLSDQTALEDEIADTQVAIEQTEIELAQAEEEEQKQYEAMKLRIQYMYENSTQESLIEAIVGAESLADLLKRVEYVAQVHKADRELTEQYKLAVQVVEAKKTALTEQMDTLLMKQEAYIGRQMQIEEMIAQLEGEQDTYASQLASAQAKAAEYQKTIAEQDAIIQKQREEEERKRQQEEEQKRQEEANNNNNNSDEEEDTTVPSNPKGQDIVDYALQFVGNPYVWGGNSLTEGCDCSGFVHLIYKHFGYTLPRYSMSFLNVGVEVSREDIQPGDIVVYEKKNGVGHVAIYIGNGKIVEAQSTKAGITSSRSVDNREIAGIRRIVD